MGRSPGYCLLVLLLFVGSACSTDGVIREDASPQLVREVTLTPPGPAVTRVLSPTPIALAVSTAEIQSPLQVATADFDSVFVTPTLPPSKTPTLTPTRTPVVTATSSPSVTVTATRFAPAPPTAVSVQATAPLPAPPTRPQSCATAWYFGDPQPPNCPLHPPLISEASLQQFEQGFMIWVREQDAIYVLYDSAQQPRWQAFQDRFEEGMAEVDPMFDNAPPYTWQPRRGFGLIWRADAALRDRIGWAVRAVEEPYSTQVQIGSDGVIYLQDSRGGIIVLRPNGTDWDRYSS